VKPCTEYDCSISTIAIDPDVRAAWICRFPRGHNAIEIRSQRQIITLYVSKTGLIRVFKKGRELK
jgi:hypothetical protein